ncbi:MAG: transcriptional regulator, DeoR family [Herbinix sp.]|jgi:DeoR/GlpR family transcriptional regulator of sugar metabolism|nr:transcriptional regulator, DeoR family [Herbinix sp.]
MAAKDRLELIKQFVMNEKKVLVANLSTQFEVTEETIRRDLEKLESEGFLTRTYGGAILNSESSLEGIHFYKRTTTNQEAKQAIAIKAVELLKNKATAAADSSSTVMEVLKLVKGNSELTLLTNSTEALRELSQSDMTVVSTGGILNKSALSLQGAITKATIKNYIFDVVLLSCKGLNRDKGALDSNEAEAELKREMLKQSNEVVLLVDHTKFDKTAFLKLSDFEHIDYLVTDRKPSDDWIEFLKSKDVNLIY